MRSVIRSFAATVFACVGFSAPPGSPAKAIENYGKLPLHFESNQGQVDPHVRFLTRLPEMTIYLTDNETVLSWHREKQQAVVRMKLTGAVTPKRVEGAAQLPGVQNYFLGRDPSKWTTNIPLYEKVHYKGIYPGIDAVFYGNRQKLEWDFVVAPNTDPDQIALNFSGAKSLKLAASGDLVIQTEIGSVQLDKPVIYQHRAGKRQTIEGSYDLIARNRVKFRLGDYDHHLPLVIDPTLAYSTLLGDSPYGGAQNVVVDSGGNMIIVGGTDANDFPTINAVQPYNSGYSDVVVAKLNPSGTALLYATYLGGSSFDWGFAVDTDAAGNAYILGQTRSRDFPVRSASQINHGGDIDAFVAKLNPNGDALVYSTFLGGSGRDTAGLNGIAVQKATGDTYVAGETTSSDFTVLSPSQSTFGGCQDAFIAKYNSAGVKQFATYIGASGCDFGQAVALDKSSNLYLGGGTDGQFPVTAGAYKSPRRGSTDVFVAKFRAGTLTSDYIAVFGGSKADILSDLAVHSSGSVYVTGRTESSDFLVTAGASQQALRGGRDGFVTCLNPLGRALTFSTYLGGRKDDDVLGLAVEEPSGNVVITGYTFSSDFPSANAIQPVKPGGNSVVRITNDAGSTWIGADNGIPEETTELISIDPANRNNALVATISAIYRTTNGGVTWVRATGIGHPRAITHANSNIVYAGVGTDVYRSQDGGSSWSRMSSIPGFAGQTYVWTLAVHPQNPNVVYAGTSGTGVLYSSDGGTTWTQRNNGFSNTEIVRLAISPANPQVLYAATRDLLYKSLDAGGLWTSPTNLLWEVTYLAPHPLKSDTLFVTTRQQIGRTDDGGTTWKWLAPPFMQAGVVSIAQADPSRVYATAMSTRGGHFVLRSTDGGGTWDSIGVGMVETRSIAVAPSDASTVYWVGSVFNAAFVTRLNANGKSYLYSTFLGGDLYPSVATGIALNASGAYIAGGSAADFPTTAEAYAERGRTFVAKIINSTAPCSYQIRPTGRLFYGSGGEQVFSVVAPSGCRSVVTATSPWIHVIEEATGTGTRSVIVGVDSNAGPSRSGSLQIGDQIATIRQTAGNCSYRLAPALLSVPASGGTYDLTLTADTGCDWAFDETVNWVTVSPSKGNGSSTITVAVAPYHGPVGRYAQVEIDDFATAITQIAANGTPPAAPSKPTPANGAQNVPLTSGLKWQASSGASSYDVYFGATNPPPLLGSTVTTGYQLPLLATGTTYYWYAVAKNNAGQTTSPVWSFKTLAVPAAPTKPSPASGAINVSRTPTLQWQAAAGATAYDVYCGTTANPPKIGNTTAPSYSPGTLQAKKKYYWRVVSKSATGVKTSPTWSFTTK